MKYRVLVDYGSYEGMRWEGGEFDTVDDAVKFAVENSYDHRFHIVTVVDWKAIGEVIFYAPDLPFKKVSEVE